jgi:hypothetical protein
LEKRSLLLVAIARAQFDGARAGGRSLSGAPIGLPAELEGDMPNPPMPGRNLIGLLEVEPSTEAAKECIEGASWMSPYAPPTVMKGERESFEPERGTAPGVPGGRGRGVEEEESSLSWDLTLSSSLSPDPARARESYQKEHLAFPRHRTKKRRTKEAAEGGVKGWRSVLLPG